MVTGNRIINKWSRTISFANNDTTPVPCDLWYCNRIPWFSGKDGSSLDLLHPCVIYRELVRIRAYQTVSSYPGMYYRPPRAAYIISRERQRGRAFMLHTDSYIQLFRY